MPIASLRSIFPQSLIAAVILLPAGLIAQNPMAPTAPESTPAAAVGTTPDHPVRVSSGVMAAQSIHHPGPAVVSGAGGGVVLKVLIDQKGKVVRSTPMSGPSALVDSATRAVSQWTYKPLLLNGTPVYVETTVMIVFRQ